MAYGQQNQQSRPAYGSKSAAPAPREVTHSKDERPEPTFISGVFGPKKAVKEGSKFLGSVILKEGFTAKVDQVLSIYSTDPAKYKGTAPLYTVVIADNSLDKK